VAALMTEQFPRGAEHVVDNALPDAPILMDAAPD
jgi:hypothetical protein